MSRIVLTLPLLLALPLGSQDLPPFEPLPAGEYLCHLTQAEVTVAAEPYDEPRKVQTAFGRIDPNLYGFLPILVVISNDTDGILDVSDLRVQLVVSGGRAIDPTPPGELANYRNRGRWGSSPPIRISPPWGERPPHPLSQWAIGGRAFRSEFVSPRSYASGYFYFEAPVDGISGAKLYLRGFHELPSGKELMYYEIDLSPYTRQRREQTHGRQLREDSTTRLLPSANE